MPCLRYVTQRKLLKRIRREIIHTLTPLQMRLMNYPLSSRRERLGIGNGIREQASMYVLNAVAIPSTRAQHRM